MRKQLSAGMLLVLVGGAAAAADWNRGDPHVMHFPQHDINGAGQNAFDVNVSLASGLRNGWVADDWQAATTTAVTGIHIWGGWYDNHRMPGPGFTDHGTFQLAIYDTASTGGPGTLQWSQVFNPGSYKTRLAPNAAFTQWLDPGATPSPFAGDSYQINFTIPASSAFAQVQGQRYWLAVNNTVDVDGDGDLDLQDMMFTNWFGWRNSSDHFGASAVHAPGDPLALGPTTPPASGWATQQDPNGQPRFDMAFVVTPAPGSLAVLAAAGLAATRRRR